MTRKADDMVGWTNDMITVIRRDPRPTTPKGHAYWICRCACGNEFSASGANIRRGHQKSCGCLRRVNMKRVQENGQGWKNGNLKHGHTIKHKPSPTWISWYGMRKRCNDPDNPYYGGRGVSYDPRWDDFEVFLAEMGERPAGMTLDRIDPYGNYEPGNVRWATAKEQANNKRAR